jgi:chlorite dismutase
MRMDTHLYYHYLFFNIDKDFYQLPKREQDDLRQEFKHFLINTTRAVNQSESMKLLIDSYITFGFKVPTTFMLWCRASDPGDVPDMLRDLWRTKFGKYLSLSQTYFGMVRNSEYSGRTGKPEQVMQLYEDRLPYFVLYPFTKTSEWHAMPAEERRTMMGEHIKVGIGHAAIRQCLLYSYGVDDQEFLVSYEMKTLQEFQDLVIAMRRTTGRKYTLIDTPIYTCLYKPLEEFIEWI